MASPQRTNLPTDLQIHHGSSFNISMAIYILDIRFSIIHVAWYIIHVGWFAMAILPWDSSPRANSPCGIDQCDKCYRLLFLRHYFHFCQWRWLWQVVLDSNKTEACPLYKDSTPDHKNNVVYAVQWGKVCLELYTGENKQPFHKRRKSNATGSKSAVYFHLKEKEYSFEDPNIHHFEQGR